MPARLLALGAMIVWMVVSPLGLAATPTQPDTADVHIRAHDADILFAPHISVHAIDLTAILRPRAPAKSVNLDDAHSFSIRVLQGCARMRGEQLAALFNRHVLAYSPRSLNDLAFSSEQGRLLVTGGVRLWNHLPPFWLAFRASGQGRIQDNGLIALQVDSIHTLGVPVAGALKLAHLSLTSLLKLERPGVRVAGNSVQIDTRAVLPGPALLSRPTHLALTRAGLKVCFGDGRVRPLAVSHAIDTGPSFIWVEAASVQALGQRIAPARLLVKPAQATTVPGLSFALYDSRPQIAAGTLRLRTDGTLVIRVADPAHN